MKQKLFSLLLAVAASVGTMFAQDTKIGNLYYNLNATNKTAEVTYGEYSGLTTANIPASVTYSGTTYSVTSIGNDAFYKCSSLTSVTIGNSVTSIGDEAFLGCSSLTSVTIGNSVTSIGDLAFSGCSSLTKVNITDIAAWCNIAFDGNTSNPLYYAKHLFVNDVEVTELVIPNGVTSIGQYAFDNCSSLTSVTIPNSVTSIGSSAFSGCSSLTSVTIPNSVTSIGDYAFYYCSSLTSVTLNSNAIVSQEYSLNSNIRNIFGSQVKEYIIGESVTSIGKRAFAYCSGLTSVTIPNSVTSIGYLAFSSCSSLTSVTIPNSVTSIGESAFSSCSSLTSVTLNSNTIVGKDYEYNSNIKSIFGEQVTEYILGDEITSIGVKAFYGCSSLTSVTIPNSVTSIGNYAFQGCSGLTSVTIPNSVTSIGDGAFLGCSGLTSVTIPNSVTSIGSSAFCSCSSLTSVTIPNSVTSIGYSAFKNCSGLTSVTIPNSVTSISDYAFSSCSSLTSVTIPNSVTRIGYEAFYYCTGLTSVTIPNSVTSIGVHAFSGCSGLTSVTIGNSVTSIGYEAFSYCSSLTAIYVPCGEMERFKQLLNNDSRVKYAPVPYSITITAENGSVAYPQTTCDDMQLTATPYNGYHFVKWSDGNTDNPRAIELTCDTTFTAEFAPNQYTLSLQCDENQGSVEGAGVFDYLAEVQISATPAYGYHFSSWSDGNTDNPRTYTVTKDITLTANFALNKYALNVSCNAEQGSVLGSGSYNYLSNRTIEAIPNYGYHFAQWNDGNTDNPRTFELTCDTTFTALFALNQYTLSLQCDDNQGTVEGAGVFDYLTEVQISATPAYGYHFSSWSDGNTDNPRTYSVTKDVALTANFALNKYALNVSCNAEQGSVSGSGSYNYLSNRTIEAIPNYGYHFAQWSDGNKENPRTIVMTQDTAYAAEFAVDKSGVCGDDNLLTWTFEDESKTLAISGEGTLNSNYTFGVEAPTQTERLIIAEGVTSVGNNAFKDMSSTITSLALPSTVTEIGDYAFAGMNNRKFNTLVLPNTIIRIGAHAFDGASYLQTIHFGSTLEEIGDYAFNGCTRVKQMTCLAEITPNVGTDGLTSINSLAELYVPNEYLFDYQIDSNWSRFLLKPYGATETTVTDNDVAVVADDNTATFTWPTSNTADSYTIDITKDGVLFCQLTFNANGQLTGIAFAPGRNGQSMAPAATLTTSGMQFTVTGLNSGTNYAFNLTVKSGSTVVASYTGAFATTGGVPTSTDVLQSDHAPRKFMRDNQVLIMRGGKTYTIQGVEVK